MKKGTGQLLILPDMRNEIDCTERSLNCNIEDFGRQPVPESGDVEMYSIRR